MKKVLPPNAILVPDNASRVFKGQIFDVYQWPQQMFDESTETFELLKRPDTVQIIAVKDGKIALVHDEQPDRGVRLHFPGGRAELSEVSWLSAAQRELLEETGLSFTSWRLINVVQPIPKAEWFAPWFLAIDFISETRQTLDAGEKIRVEWFEFEAAQQLIMSGKEPTMNYAMPLFSGCKSLEELLELPEFKGQSVDC